MTNIRTCGGGNGIVRRRARRESASLGVVLAKLETVSKCSTDVHVVAVRVKWRRDGPVGVRDEAAWALQRDGLSPSIHTNGECLPFIVHCEDAVLARAAQPRDLPVLHAQRWDRRVHHLNIKNIFIVVIGAVLMFL